MGKIIAPSSTGKLRSLRITQSILYQVEGEDIRNYRDQDIVHTLVSCYLQRKGKTPVNKEWEIWVKNFYEYLTIEFS